MEYKPFTYVATHVLTGKKYYGVKYSNRPGHIANPSVLWTTYFTSSRVVRSLIDTDGKDSFIFEIRKIFKDAKSAIRHEQTVIRRMKMHRRDDWMNKAFVKTTKDDALDRLVVNSKGIKRSAETRKRMSESNKRRAPCPQSKRDKLSYFRKNSVEGKAQIERMAAMRRGKPGKGKTYIVTSPECIVYNVTNLALFCKEHGLNKGSMQAVGRGENPSCKGWKVAKTSDSYDVPSVI